MLRKFSVRFNMPLFPIGIMVAVGLSRDELVGRLEAKGCSRNSCLSEWTWEPGEHTMGHTAVLPCHRVALWFPYADVEPSTVAHEAFHIVHGALPQLGVNMCDDSEEVFAYALDRTFDLVTKALSIAKSS